MNESDNRNFLLSAEEKLIRAHDGAMALLFIHIRHTGHFDREKAAEDLCMTMSELSAAEEKLRRAGLMEPEQMQSPAVSAGDESAIKPFSASDVSSVISSRRDSPESKTDCIRESPVLFPPQDPPQFTAADVEELAARDPAFGAVLQEARVALGQDMNSNDLRRFCSVYHTLGLPPEVLFVLLNYCSELSASHSRKLTMGFIEKNAYTWVNSGIHTMEDAENFCERQKELSTMVGKVRSALGIHDKLTDKQTEYVSMWIEMGFDDAAIYEAYDRAVTTKDTKSFAYINGILKNWHAAGVHTTEEIRSYESGHASGKSQKKTAAAGNEVPVSMDEARDILGFISGENKN